MNMIKTFDLHVEIATAMGHSRASIGEKVSQALDDAFKGQNICHYVTDVDDREKRSLEILTPFGWIKSKRDFKIGDVIAYSTLDDNRPDWVAWEVGKIDENFLYAKVESNCGKQDNIAKGCAFLVRAVEDRK